MVCGSWPFSHHHSLRVCDDSSQPLATQKKQSWCRIQDSKIALPLSISERALVSSLVK